MRAIIFALFALFFISLSAQETKKDTLFFKYDQKYIKTFTEIPETYYLADSHDGDQGAFFFKEEQRFDNLKNTKLRCLKKFVRSSQFFDSKKKLHDYEIAGLFGKYVIFLVRKNGVAVEYIKVVPGFQIE
ncbi:hypothetical protein [Flavobacterium hercynium]|uniref:Uncharacterized protein n=1 Tax=Flavobacterium hercynium TaxID=387094 RepID=A0A226HGI3_9FLAO|nr:hypothetical protein [Flavobacterium hercynium]OXA92550.1 hypothetical protein B0A66_09735 [Flavobacterium hercynium]PAM94188.1 hypothetical protein B4N84_14030 [Flavobacterium sp. IR1]SMP21283.1 hypothetical protein SAMN06265346_1078 [Flavobacterium hercynium]